MPQTPKTPIPVTILTGFLGSGKTTLLNHILKADHGLRIAVLVNDFGAVNIDAQLVVGVEGEGDTVSLSNGCICCTIRDDLAKAVLDLMFRPEPPEYIIVETSGVSDPVSVANTFAVMSGLRVDSILTVVDAEQYTGLQRVYSMLAIEQIGIADIVVLNKVDLVTPQQKEDIKRLWIREVNPKARIIEATFGQVPLELILGVGNFAPEKLAHREARDIHVHEVGIPTDHDHHHDEHHHDEHHHDDHHHTDHSLVFSTWTWTSDQPLSFKALRKAVEQLPETIYRAKGIFFLADAPERRAVLQVVGWRVRLTLGEPWGEETPRSQVVFIASYDGLDREAIGTLFENTLAVHAADRENIIGKALDWLRRSAVTQ